MLDDAGLADALGMGLVAADEVGLAAGAGVGLAAGDGVGLAAGDGIGLAAGDGIGLADAVGADEGAVPFGDSDAVAASGVGIALGSDVDAGVSGVVAVRSLGGSTVVASVPTPGDSTFTATALGGATLPDASAATERGCRRGAEAALPPSKSRSVPATVLIV